MDGHLNEMFICQEGDKTCNKTYASKKSLQRHMRFKHPETKKSCRRHMKYKHRTSQPASPIHKMRNDHDEMRTPVTAMDMEEKKMFVCRESDNCSKKFGSQRSLVRHVRKKHLPSQLAESIQQVKQPAVRRIIPLLLTPANASTLSQEASTQTTPSVRAGYDFLDHEQHSDDELNRGDVTNDEYEKSGEVRDKNRNYSIVKDFLAYWNDVDVEIRSLDLIALFLIQHSRIVKEKDANYLATTSAYSNMMYATNQLHLQTLFNLSNNFYVNIRKHNGLFDWNCLVIAFTMAHELLMDYPHLYPDIVDMLLEVLNLAGDDLTKLGGWNNFVKYSEKFFS